MKPRNLRAPKTRCFQCAGCDDLFHLRFAVDQARDHARRAEWDPGALLSRLETRCPGAKK